VIVVGCYAQLKPLKRWLHAHIFAWSLANAGSRLAIPVASL
jgi:hypothetical protein